MTITTRGNSFLVSVGSGKDRFKRTYKSLAEAKAEEATEIARRAHLKLSEYTTPTTTQNGLVAPVKSGYTLQQGYYAACRETDWKDNSGAPQRNARLVIKELGGDTDLAEINTEMILEMASSFEEEESNSGSTINKKLSALSVILKLAEERGWISRTPRIPRRSESAYRIRFYDADEEESMLSMCDLMGMLTLADFIEMGIDTGFRRMELMNLEIADCHNGAAILHAGTTKSGKARSVPLTDRCLAIIKKRKALGYRKIFEDFSAYQLRRDWALLKDALGKTDDQHFLVHVLRHTCASRLAMEGQTAPFIMAWMGHSSIVVTQRYMHLNMTTLLAGKSSLDSYRKPTKVG